MVAGTPRDVAMLCNKYLPCCLQHNSDGATRPSSREQSRMTPPTHKHTDAAETCTPVKTYLRTPGSLQDACCTFAVTRTKQLQSSINMLPGLEMAGICWPRVGSRWHA